MSLDDVLGCLFVVALLALGHVATQEPRCWACVHGRMRRCPYCPGEACTRCGTHRRLKR